MESTKNHGRLKCFKSPMKTGVAQVFQKSTKNRDERRCFRSPLKTVMNAGVSEVH
jgi:hypothetical protein